MQIEPGNQSTKGPAEPGAPREIERRYATREAKQRLHQSEFREMILDAYEGRCALSGLPVRRLLQASHIVADSESGGIAAVTNGIALSSIHHAAFDAHLVGINPGGVIRISDRLMQMTDGPCWKMPSKPWPVPGCTFLRDRPTVPTAISWRGVTGSSLGFPDGRRSIRRALLIGARTVFVLRGPASFGRYEKISEKQSGHPVSQRELQ